MRWSMNRFIVPTQERRGLADDDADDEGDTETDDDGTQRQSLDYEGEHADLREEVQPRR